ncbi:hypothetical protein HZH66_010440 [Vespula vulgaris]|uniref:Ig-like domain-containing protein n=1 Tax=Vespula vulgaris TaxID=7454 RepID=A0A834JIZ0_VESVU|nr:hypothetical protein HZH66_010440 [Vespula vulgaris]
MEKGISEASVQLQQPKLPSPIQVGGEVELRCHVDGSGDMKYGWFKLVTELWLFRSPYMSARNKRWSQ